MQFSIDFGPAYSLATLKLDAGESVKTESGAVVTMGPGLEIETGTGTAWVQTRSPRAFLDWLLPLLPKDHT
jgi:uncharacterized protein (AIM24 family)